MKRITALLFFTGISLIGVAQERLELLETNIGEERILAHSESYMWTKNWWLSAGMRAPVEKGGNTLAASSKLNDRRLDSLSRLFNKYLPSRLIRLGNLQPRINYLKDHKSPPYILATIFEINGQEVKSLGQFRITFHTTFHNQMPDVMDIQVTAPEKIKAYDRNYVLKTHKRKPTDTEREITPPEIQGIE